MNPQTPTETRTLVSNAQGEPILWTETFAAGH